MCGRCHAEDEWSSYWIIMIVLIGVTLAVTVYYYWVSTGRMMYPTPRRMMVSLSQDPREVIVTSSQRPL